VTGNADFRRVALSVAGDGCPSGPVVLHKILRKSLGLEALAERGNVRFHVPEHFQIEVSRILIIRGRKGKAPRGEKWLESALLSLDAAPIDTYAQGINFDLMGKLSKAYGLDVPDVPYFHLAREMVLPGGLGNSQRADGNSVKVDLKLN
jgi:hypothetical protein